MTWHLNHCGHLSLGDGSVLRIDFECKRYVASFYTQGPDHLELRAYAVGGFETCRDLVNSWSDAFEASLTSPSGGIRGEGSGQVQPIPCPEPPNMLGEKAS